MGKREEWTFGGNGEEKRVEEKITHEIKSTI